MKIRTRIQLNWTSEPAEKAPEQVCVLSRHNALDQILTLYNYADAEVVQREEEAIKLDGLNVAQVKELREKSEKFTFQAEVNRMMKLIINSLYRNKEVLFKYLDILQYILQ